jgi:HD superfamily phosphodiesterase
MIKEKVKQIYESLPVNKWGHVKRVLAFATKLSEELNLEESEKRIIQISALLHDIGYKKQFEIDGEDLHEKYSVEMVDEIISEEGFSEEEIKIIKEIISTHGIFENCKTKFQKILFDADKLEKTTMGEIIRKSIIMHEKFKMNDEQIFLRLMEKMNERKFHFKESEKIAKKNKEKIFESFNHYRELFEYADEIEKKFNL